MSLLSCPFMSLLPNVTPSYVTPISLLPMSLIPNPLDRISHFMLCLALSCHALSFIVVPCTIFIVLPGHALPCPTSPFLFTVSALPNSGLPLPLLFLGSGAERVDDLCFHTYGEFSPSSSSPSIPHPPTQIPSLEA